MGKKKVGEISFITSGLHTCICVTSNKKLMYAKEKSTSESFLAKKKDISASVAKSKTHCISILRSS